MNRELSFEDLKDEMTPVPGFSQYLCHTISGHVWSKLRNSWILDEETSKGTGDNGKYLLTKLKSDNGESVPMYKHEIVMSSAMGITKNEWRAMGLEVDHINNKNTKDCSISNLRLVNSKLNKQNSSYRYWNKVRLSFEIAEQLREEFKQFEGSKVEWYQLKGKELGVTARSVQNVILGYTYKQDENVA